MSEQNLETPTTPPEGEQTPPTVPPVTPPDAGAEPPEPVGQTDATTNPDTSDAPTDDSGTAPTQPGDEGIDFRPSSDFEQEAS